jgi:hypothetical protein
MLTRKVVVNCGFFLAKEGNTSSKILLKEMVVSLGMVTAPLGRLTVDVLSIN